MTGRPTVYFYLEWAYEIINDEIHPPINLIWFQITPKLCLKQKQTKLRDKIWDTWHHILWGTMAVKKLQFGPATCKLRPIQRYPPHNIPSLSVCPLFLGCSAPPPPRLPPSLLALLGSDPVSRKPPFTWERRTDALSWRRENTTRGRRSRRVYARLSCPISTCATETVTFSLSLCS